MRTKTSPSALKGLLLLSSLFIAFVVQGQVARDTDRDIELVKKDHLGLTVSFGVRSSTLKSNHSAIDGMQALEEGGSAGLVWGSRAFETKLVMGYYYSAARVKHTVDMIEMEASSHFYPLRAIKKGTSRINPYFSAGVTKNYYKLYGFYTKDNVSPINYSVSREPYLGKLDVYNASLGAGVAINLMNDYDFVKLFAAAQYNKPFRSIASTDFHQTQTSDQWSFNLGVSFGTNRFKDN